MFRPPWRSRALRTALRQNGGRANEASEALLARGNGDPAELATLDTTWWGGGAGGVAPDGAGPPASSGGAGPRPVQSETVDMEGASPLFSHPDEEGGLAVDGLTLRQNGGRADEASEALLARGDAIWPGGGAGGAASDGAGLRPVLSRTGDVEGTSPLFARPDEEGGLEMDGLAPVPLPAGEAWATYAPLGDGRGAEEDVAPLSNMSRRECCCWCLLVQVLVALLGHFPTHGNKTHVRPAPSPVFPPHANGTSPSKAPSPLLPTAAPSMTEGTQYVNDYRFTTSLFVIAAIIEFFIFFRRLFFLCREERQLKRCDYIRLVLVSMLLSTSVELEQPLHASKAQYEDELPAWQARWIFFSVAFCIVLKLIMAVCVKGLRQLQRKQIWKATNWFVLAVSMVWGVIKAPEHKVDQSYTGDEGWDHKGWPAAALLLCVWLFATWGFFLVVNLTKVAIQGTVLFCRYLVRNPFAQKEPTLRVLLSLDPFDLRQRSQFDNDAVRRAVMNDAEAAATIDTFNVGQGRLGRVRPLFMAVALGASHDVVSLLCDACPEAVGETDWCGSAPLHVACTHGCPVEVVRVLVARCPSVLGRPDGWGYTPLHVASAMRAPSAEVVRFLIESYPAALFMKDGRGRTPLDLVRRYDAPSDVVQLLVEGTSLEASRNIDGDAIQRGREVMRRMLDTDSEPEPVPPEYLEYCAGGFSDEQRIGEGTFGDVYEGVDRVLRRKFAVKRLRIKIAESVNAHQAKRSFERELATLQHFRHPNIARLHAYFLSPLLRGHQCLVFELAANGSLDGFLKQNELKKNLNWTRRINIALDVARALEYLHKGMAGQICFHRDVKSANICLRRDFTALLIDCGVSRMIPDNESNATMSIMGNTGHGLQGSSGYICPMFAHTMKDFTSANEIFSLGVVLTELFTGKLQGSKVDEQVVNIFDWYSEDGTEKKELQNYADIAAGDWESSIKHGFACLSVSCISLNPGMRPTIQDIVKILGKLSSKARPWSPGERNCITVLFSNPLVWADDGGELHAIEPLNFAKEKDLLIRCMAEARRDIGLSFDVATDDRLQVSVTKRCGCLHFSGHGHPDALIFEDGGGGAHWLGEDELYDSVHNEPFKFVFVSACHSSLMGRALVNAGVPHVVCCRYEERVMDEAAIKFMNTFYYALAEGYTIEAAFEKGKVAVSRRFSEEVDKFLLLPQDGDHDEPLFDAEFLEWEDEKNAEQYIPAPPHFLGGREVSMYRLIQVILSCQLVTLIGEDGVGCSSLASAVCHYINERKTTVQSIKDVYFVRLWERQEDSNFGTFIKHLNQQLVAEGKAAKVEKGSLCDISCAIIKALAGTKALVVFDGIDSQDPSCAAFAKLLFEKTSTTKILLTARAPINFSFAGIEENIFDLGPLDIQSTFELFDKLCPHSEGSNKLQKIINESEPSDSVSIACDNKQIMAIYEKLGSGIPAKTVSAAKETSKEEYIKLISRSPEMHD